MLLKVQKHVYTNVINVSGCCVQIRQYIYCHKGYFYIKRLGNTDIHMF